MKKVLVTLLLAVSCIYSNAQEYNTAIGFKGAFPGWGALSVKHFFAGQSAIEGNLGIGRNAFWLQLLYERNQSIAGAEGLDWYWGVGGDLGAWDHYYFDRYYHDRVYNGDFFLGADAVVGLEYTIPTVPLNFALDVGPTLRVLPYTSLYFGASFAIRFAIR